MVRQKGFFFHYGEVPGLGILADNRQEDWQRLNLYGFGVDIDAIQKAVESGCEESLTARGLLAARPGKVFSTDEIVAAVWPDRDDAAAEDVKKYVHMLRAKIEEHPGQPKVIVTVRGFGYRFVPPEPTGAVAPAGASEDAPPVPGGPVPAAPDRGDPSAGPGPAGPTFPAPPTFPASPPGPPRSPRGGPATS